MSPIINRTNKSNAHGYTVADLLTAVGMLAVASSAVLPTVVRMHSAAFAASFSRPVIEKASSAAILVE